MAIETGGTILKRTADGREVLSSCLDSDAGEERLGAFLNLQVKDGGGQSDGQVDERLSPASGPYNAQTQVTFNGTFDPTGTYMVLLYLSSDTFSTSGYAASGPVTETTLVATVISGPDTEVVPGPGPVMIQVRQHVDSSWVDVGEPYTFTYTA
jgi:hypothetical protein